MKKKPKPLSLVSTPQAQLAQVQSSLVKRGLEHIESTALAAQIRFLVVNDFDEALRSIRKVVESFEGIEIVGEARTGIEAIDQYEALLPDVVCMNVNMPEMNGIEATRIITDRHPSARIFMLTVMSEAKFMRAAMLAGALDYIVMPPSTEDLESTIRRLAAYKAPIKKDLLDIFAQLYK